MQDYKIDRADFQDVKDIGALFTESFRESVLFHCGRIPKPLAAQDIFTVVLSAEPEASFVVRTKEDTVIGYCFAPSDISKIWCTALIYGHIFKWLWRWLTGQYGVGLHPVKMVFLNKLAFFQSAFTPGVKAKARVLSIAVSKTCRSRGIGKALIEEALRYLHSRHVLKVRLEVRPNNISAIKVYRGQGFVPVGTTRDPQGEWLIMLKEMEY